MPKSDKPSKPKAKIPKPKKPATAKKPVSARTGKQVAALPVSLDPEGRLRVLLETSRETKRFIIPKGWPEKGMKDWQVAALEAKEEAGLKGRIGKEPIGEYTYWKRLPKHFQQVKVKVFVLEAERQMAVWREKGQRKLAWFLIEDAIKLVDEPGMVALLKTIPTKQIKPRPLSEDTKVPLPASDPLPDRIGAVRVTSAGASLREVIAASLLPAEGATDEDRENAGRSADEVLAQVARLARMAG